MDQRTHIGTQASYRPCLIHNRPQTHESRFLTTLVGNAIEIERRSNALSGTEFGHTIINGAFKPSNE